MTQQRPYLTALIIPLSKPSNPVAPWVSLNCTVIDSALDEWPMQLMPVQTDEDVSIENLILGQPSGERQTSFQRWLKSWVATV